MNVKSRSWMTGQDSRVTGRETELTNKKGQTMNKELVYTTFRQGHLAPNVHLSELRLIKDAFARVKVRTAMKVKRLEESSDMDFEDQIDLERDVLMNYGGAIALMKEIEQLAGMETGALLTKQDASIYVSVPMRRVCNG